MNKIKAYGTESLKKAIFDSDGVSETTVQAYGELAGNEASVICRSGSACNLDCKGTGCSGLVHEGETGATCNIDPGGCALNNTVSDVNGIICPDVTTSTKAKKLLIEIAEGGDDVMMADYTKIHVVDKDITKIKADVDAICSSEQHVVLVKNKLSLVPLKI